MEPKFFDNKLSIVKDDLAKTIEDGDSLAVAAATFSMYAYQELKEQLDGLDDFRFIFTSQAFTQSRARRRSGSSTSRGSTASRAFSAPTLRSGYATS